VRWREHLGELLRDRFAKRAMLDEVYGLAELRKLIVDRGRRDLRVLSGDGVTPSPPARGSWNKF